MNFEQIQYNIQYITPPHVFIDNFEQVIVGWLAFD